MPKNSVRTRANAALRRNCGAFRAQVNPVTSAVGAALRGLRGVKGAQRSARKTARPDWKIETLEPRLLLSADLAPGAHDIEGMIDQPGEQDRYEFVVTEKTRFFFDGVQGDQVQWQLDGPTAADSFSLRNLTSAGDLFLDLDPGTYRLTVDGQGDSSGAYAFRLFGTETARPLTPGAETSGRLEPGTQASMYAVMLQAGDRFFVEAGPNNLNGQWTLFAPDATRVAGPVSLATDGPALTAARTGTYWLAVEGTAGSTRALDYAFKNGQGRLYCRSVWHLGVRTCRCAARRPLATGRATRSRDRLDQCIGRRRASCAGAVFDSRPLRVATSCRRLGTR